MKRRSKACQNPAAPTDRHVDRAGKKRTPQGTPPPSSAGSTASGPRHLMVSLAQSFMAHPAERVLRTFSGKSALVARLAACHTARRAPSSAKPLPPAPPRSLPGQTRPTRRSTILCLHRTCWPGRGQLLPPWICKHTDTSSGSPAGGSLNAGDRFHPAAANSCSYPNESPAGSRRHPQ